MSSCYLTGGLSFLLPVFLMAAAYIMIGIHPFGDRSILLVDGKLQYAAFFSEYLRQLRSFELPLFSRFFGPGMDFYGTWAYYLASPLNLILLLFPKSYILDGMFAVLLVKTGLCGTTFYIYARKVLASEQWKALLFSTSYALCGFLVSYSDNMQWFDGMIWLPIIIMGIETIYRKGHAFYYAFAVAALVISNFYISVPVGLFCILYSIYISVRESKEDFPGSKQKFLLKIGWNSLLGIGMAAFVMIPVYYLLRNQMGLIGQKLPTNLFDGNLINTIGGLFAGRQDNVSQSGLPRIYSGLLAVVAAPAYFLGTGIKKREKIATALFLTFVFVCFHVPLLNYVWHGMDFVGWFPFRYSFVFSFLILHIAVKAMNTPLSAPFQSKLFRLFILTLLSLCILSFILVRESMSLYPMIIVMTANIIFIFIYYITMQKSRPSPVILLFILCAELLINMNLEINTLNKGLSFENYDKWTNSYRTVEAAIDNSGLRLQQGRTAIALETITANDPLLFELEGMDFYASTGSTNLSHALAALGYQWYLSSGFEISDNGGSLLLNSLMGVSSTIIETTDLGNGGVPATVFPVRHLLREDDLGEVTVIDNPLALSRAYLVNKDILSFSSKDLTDNPFALTDRLLSAMLNKDTITYKENAYTLQYTNVQPADYSSDYTKYAVQDLSEESSVTITFMGKGENIPLYLNMGYDTFDRKTYAAELTVKLIYNQKEQQIKYSDPTVVPLVLSLGSFPKDKPVTVEIDFWGQDLGIRYLRVISSDPLDIAEALTPLYGNQADIEWTSSNSVSLKQNSTVNGILFVSIPYNSGWSAHVNGKPADVLCVADAFIGISLEAGNNTVTMDFLPEGLKAGICISLGFFAVAFMQVIFYCSYKKDRNKSGSSAA